MAATETHTHTQQPQQLSQTRYLQWPKILVVIKSQTTVRYLK